MKAIHVLIWCLVLYGFLTVQAAVGQDQKPNGIPGDEISKLVGNWSGESICVNKEKFPGCKDEVVVYHITKVADKADTVNISADKIVNGKAEFMGAFDAVYDAKKQTLTSEFKNERVHLLIEFVVKGDSLEGGIISLPDKTQVRRIKVKRDK